MSDATLIRDQAAWWEYAKGFSWHQRFVFGKPRQFPCLVASLADGGTVNHFFIYPDDAALLLEAYEASR